MYAGDPAEGERVLAPLRDLGDPIADLSGIMPYAEAQAILDEDYPDGWRYYWKFVDLEALGDDVLERLTDHAAQGPSHHSTIDVWFHGGAMDRIDPAATAFGARPEQGDEANVAWAREVVADLRRFSSGGSYLTFPGLFGEGEDLAPRLLRRAEPRAARGAEGPVRPGEPLRHERRHPIHPHDWVGLDQI